MKLRKLFALLMTAVMLLGMVPASHAELTDCYHDWDSGQWLSGAPANCQVSKPKTYTCTICQATRTWDENGPCNYIWSWDSHVPSCEESGVQNGVCSVCGEVTERDARGPHSWGNWHGTGGTCVNPGRQERSCTVCGATETRTGSGGEHDWGAWKTIKPGTCVESGEEERTCNLCGKTETRTTGGGGHQYGAYETVKGPKCTEPGRKEHYCRYCGRMEWDVIPATGHDMGSWYVFEAPQVGLPGIERRDCLNECGYFETREIPALEQDFDNVVINPGDVNVAPGGPNITGPDSSDNTGNPDDGFNTPSDNNHYEVITPGGSGEQAALSLTLSLSSTPANGTHFVVGETVVFTAVWANTTPYTLNDQIVSIGGTVAPVLGSELLYLSTLSPEPDVEIAPGASGSHSLTVVVSEADVANGAIHATADFSANTKEGVELGQVIAPFVTAPCGVEEDGSYEPTFTKRVYNTPANGEFFVPGEKIEFEVSFNTNDSKGNTNEEDSVYDVWCYDPLTHGQNSIYHFDKAYSVGAYPTYIVTEEDAQRGYVENTAYVTFSYTEGGETVRMDSNTVTVPCGVEENGSDAVVLEKIDMRSPANGEYYVPGEVIKYGLTVRSTEDNPLQNIIIYDPLKGGDQVVFGPADAWVLGAGFDYTVTEADAQRGYIENTGYATFTYQNTGEDGTVYSNTLTLPCGFVKDAGLSSALSVTKSVTSTPNNGSYYEPGEVIFFEITATNTSSETLTNLTFHDPLITDAPGATVPTFAPGEAASFQAFYVVTDVDAFAGSVTNVAYMTADDADGHQMVEYSNTVTVPCGHTYLNIIPTPDHPFGTFDSIAVIKKEESLPLNGQFYTEGEVIHYSITYTNDGELPLTDVQIWDVLNVTTPIASAEMLQPGESRVCYYQHTVTAEDVAAGSVMNIAHASYPVSNAAGFANSVSNVVISKTGAYNWVWVTPLFPEDATPEYTPGTGWTDLPGTTPEGALPPFGTIDTDKLRSGDSYCKRTITGRDNASASYEISFCAEHADTQSSALLMQQAAATPELQAQAATYAVALWHTEVEALYQEIYEAADPMAKMVVMTEYVRFLTELANYEALLNRLYPGQTALVAQMVAAMWEDKCVTLCYEMHADAVERTDNLLSVTPAAGAASAVCDCVTNNEVNAAKAYTQHYCPMHGFTFSMIDALLKGQDTAEAWAMVRQIWGVELTNAYNQISAKLGDNKALAMAEYSTLTQWMMAREASLMALYPENPEIVAQTMVKIIIDRVNALCQNGK